MEDNNISRFKKLQNIQLDILIYFDAIARKNNITYYLAFGSLIGAIRHNGFIPWDIDIDITLFRDDYEKVINILREKENESQYFIRKPGDKYHTSPHALLYSKNTSLMFSHDKNMYKNKKPKEVYIDLFPIDKLPMDNYLKKKQIKKIERLRKMVQIKSPTYYKSNIFYKTLKFMRSLLLFYTSNEKLQLKCDHEMNRYNESQSTIFGQFASGDYEKVVLSHADYGTPLLVKFENLNVPIPQGYDKFLTQVYGDYLTLPSKEKQNEYFALSFEVSDDRIK